MKQKEYPMDEDYNQALQFLTEQIAERDEMLEQLKLLPPEARPEGLRLLDELNKAIEKGEQALAKEYESYQNLRRLEEERDSMFDDLAERMVMVFIHIKYRHPEKLEEMKAALLNNYTPEEEQEFYDRVAIFEARDLIGLIAREGETREQTEEFLKNYRAAQNKEE
jgi:predicted RND superfamily exporter protein